MVGAAGAAAGAGGGGGGGGGVFLWQAPARTDISAAANARDALRLVMVIGVPPQFFRLLCSVIARLLLLGVNPDRFLVVTRLSKRMLAGSIGVHHPDLRLTSAL